jgi:DNA replication protein DnaC
MPNRSVPPARANRAGPTPPARTRGTRDNGLDPAERLRRAEAAGGLTPAAAAIAAVDAPTERAATCPKCRRRYTQRKVGSVYVPDLCATCSRLALDEHATELSAAARRTVDEQVGAAALAALEAPWEYEHADLAGFVVSGRSDVARQQRTVLRAAAAYLADWPERLDRAVGFPMIVILRGSPGTGKGLIGWSLARAVAGQHASPAKVATVSDMVRHLREPWHARGYGASEAARLEEWRKPAFLFLDEASRHALHGEPWQALFDVVNARAERGRATVLATNEESDEQLAAILGPAIVSRAKRYSGVWELGFWPDYDYRETLYAEAKAARQARRSRA